MKGGGGERGRGIFGQVTVMPTTNGFFTSQEGKNESDGALARL
jgi:hypothetical protein